MPTFLLVDDSAHELLCFRVLLRRGVFFKGSVASSVFYGMYTSGRRPGKKKIAKCYTSLALDQTVCKNTLVPMVSFLCFYVSIPGALT